MENKLVLNLRIEVGERRKELSLMNLILKKLNQLERSNIKVEYLELRLKRMDQLSNSKEAYMKIDANERTFTDFEISPEWDLAILNPCERIIQRFMTC